MSIWDDQDEVFMKTHGRRADGNPRTCQVCGKKPAAFWVGSDVITVCCACAEAVLPALLADAACRQALVSNGARSMDAFKTRWVQAGAHYWRAVANNLANAGKLRRPLTDEQLESAELLSDEEAAI